MAKDRALRWTVLFATLLALACVGQADGRNLARYDFDRSDRLTNAQDFAPWVDLLARQAAEQPILDDCLADQERCPMYLRGYRAIMLAAPRMPRADQLTLVNRFIDRRKWRNPNATDMRWQSLAAFLREGGNCKDFATAKYFMLRGLGFNADELRVVVAREIGKMSHHAFLAVRHGPAMQLFDADNLVYTGNLHGDYDFLYSINEIALWDHKLAAEGIAGAPTMTVGAR